MNNSIIEKAEYMDFLKEFHQLEYIKDIQEKAKTLSN